MVARSALVAQLFALSHAYDVSSTVFLMLNEFLNIKVLHNVFTDLKSVFDGIIGINPPTKKRMLIDLSVLRQSYDRREIAEVVWIPTNQNPADALTKIDSKNIHLLVEIMSNNRIHAEEKYWVAKHGPVENKPLVIFLQILL